MSWAIPFNISLSNQTRLVSSEPQILTLLIPQNLFFSLTNNYVPGVVVFCILFGLTLQFISNKKALFDVLNIISKTCILFWNWLVRFAPLATFALLANLVGTIKLNQLNDLSDFLILFFIGTLLLMLWIIPMAIVSFTDIRYRVIIYELRNALIISAITTLSVVSLPFIQQMTNQFLNEHRKNINEREKEDILKTVLLVSYPLAQLGNFFTYLFVLFAAVYYNHSITHFQYLALPIFSYLSSIGSPSSSINAVSFLANWLNLPLDTVNLYISLMPIIRYGQVLLTVMGFAFLSIIITFLFFNCVKINFKKLLFHITLPFILLIICVFSFKGFFPGSGIKNYNRLNSFSLNPTLIKNLHITIMPAFDESKVKPFLKGEDTLFRIQKSGVLRVGFNSDMRPFSFYNDKHELVGYDIAYACALAIALNARIEFVPFTWQYLVNDLEANKFDVAMSAIYVTEERLRHVAFTTSYFESPLAFVVPKINQSQFQNTMQIKKIRGLKIGVFNDPVLIPLIQNNFQNATLVILPNLSGDAPYQAFKQHKIDATLWSEAQSKVWSLGHSGYTPIVPSGFPAPFLMAYMIQRDSPLFLNFLNYWLELKKNDGFEKSTYNQWILIRPIKDSHRG